MTDKPTPQSPTTEPAPAKVDLEQWEDLNVTNGGDQYVHRVTDDCGNEIARIDGGLETWPLARAMVAAPELLAALKAIVGLPGWHPTFSGPLWDRAVAAIDKAEGKA